MSFLKNHPFAVSAHFDCSTVLTFAVPKEEIQGLIPACVSLDLYKDQWAFLAVAMVQTRALRPKGFPKFMGNDFFLIGYRIFVRYVSESGEKASWLIHYQIPDGFEKNGILWEPIHTLYVHHHGY